MPLDQNIKRVMVIGSGPIVIGQAAELQHRIDAINGIVQ